MNTDKKREWVINYLLLKNQLLAEASGINQPLTNAADLVEITTEWDEPEIEIVYDRLQMILRNKKQPLMEGIFCPWCTVFSGCSKCTYGKRHGVCGESEFATIYTQISNALPLPISHVVWNHRELFLSLDPQPDTPPLKFQYAEIGDRLWTERFGEGVVEETRKGSVSVRFLPGPLGSTSSILKVYHLDGRTRSGDINPTLHHSEPKWFKGEN